MIELVVNNFRGRILDVAFLQDSYYLSIYDAISGKIKKYMITLNGLYIISQVLDDNIKVDIEACYIDNEKVDIESICYGNSSIVINIKNRKSIYVDKYDYVTKPNFDKVLSELMRCYYELISTEQYASTLLPVMNLFIDECKKIDLEPTIQLNGYYPYQPRIKDNRFLI